MHRSAMRRLIGTNPWSHPRGIWLFSPRRSKTPQKRPAPAAGADGATAPETLRQTGLRGLDNLERGAKRAHRRGTRRRLRRG
jgi:hypothetical protein